MNLCTAYLCMTARTGGILPNVTIGMEWVLNGICQIANNNLGIAQSFIRKKMVKQISSIYKIRLTYLCEYCEETEYYQEQERSYLENQDYQ